VETLRRATEPHAIREENLIPLFAKLATRQRALEEQVLDLSRFAIETCSLMKKVVEILQRGAERQCGAECPRP